MDRICPTSRTSTRCPYCRIAAPIPSAISAVAPILLAYATSTCLDMKASDCLHLEHAPPTPSRAGQMVTADQGQQSRTRSHGREGRRGVRWVGSAGSVRCTGQRELATVEVVGLR